MRDQQKMRFSPVLLRYERTEIPFDDERILRDGVAEAASEPSDANKRSAAQALAVDASFKRYGIDRWGRDFVRANEQGQLVYGIPAVYDVNGNPLPQPAEQTPGGFTEAGKEPGKVRIVLE